MKTYKVTARRWSGGWELHIAGEGVTQVRTLENAVDQVRDYLATLHGDDYADAHVNVVPDLDGYEAVVTQAKREVAEALEGQRRASEHYRQVVAELRARGLSVTDSAAILGVSRGRVSQLTT